MQKTTQSYFIGKLEATLEQLIAKYSPLYIMLEFALFLQCAEFTLTENVAEQQPILKPCRGKLYVL